MPTFFLAARSLAFLASSDSWSAIALSKMNKVGMVCSFFLGTQKKSISWRFSGNFSLDVTPCQTKEKGWISLLCLVCHCIEIRCISRHLGIVSSLHLVYSRVPIVNYCCPMVSLDLLVQTFIL
ncbi:hypothetical protein CLU79DRAFT_777068 [Phycomyces nitens]|nr:hypothetical protein CLU79DRAFT_777068 [Phycomyces nitens]